MLVTQEVYDALVASVERWKRIMLDPRMSPAWKEDCRLCKVTVKPEACDGCPIKADGHGGCSGSPFHAAVREQTHETCGAELDYLVGLLARCEVEEPALRSRDVRPGQCYKLKGDEARELFFMQISPVGADMRSWREHHGDMLPSVRMNGNSPGEISVSQPDAEVVLVDRNGEPLPEPEGYVRFGDLAVGDYLRYDLGSKGRLSGLCRKTRKQGQYPSSGKYVHLLDSGGLEMDEGKCNGSLDWMVRPVEVVTTFGELAIGDTFRYQFGKGAAVREAVGKWSGMRRKLEGLSAVCLEADDVFKVGEQHGVEPECPVRKEVWRG